MSEPKFPTYLELAWAILDVLKDHGRPMSTSEIVLLVAKKLSLSPETIAWKHNTGPGTELQYRIGWGLTRLKCQGAVENVKRGYWNITGLGEQVWESLLNT